jgi:hypothetical protein
VRKGEIKTKFSKKIYQNIKNKFWDVIKCCMFCRSFAKIGQKILLLSRSINGQINLFIARPNEADLAFLKAKWQL